MASIPLPEGAQASLNRLERHQDEDEKSPGQDLTAPLTIPHSIPANHPFQRERSESELSIDGGPTASPVRKESLSAPRKIVVKVGMVGDSQIGKTSLMVKYVENKHNEDYVETLGVTFMEKTLRLKNTDVTCSIWDLGGQKEFLSMLPMVCNEAVAILFMFDLSRKSTLCSVKEWYRQTRNFNKTAIPFLVGTKYDYFAAFPPSEQEEITTMARRFAKAMKAPLIFCSVAYSINVQKIFKILISKLFDLPCSVEKIEAVGEPIIEF